MKTKILFLSMCLSVSASFMQAQTDDNQIAEVITTNVEDDATESRGLMVAAKAITGTANIPVGKQYAVLIGINRYQEWQPLNTAKEEAETIRNTLALNYYIDEFIELYDEQATGAGLRKLFGEELPAKLELNDSLLVFYAGHGHLDKSQNGFWIPVDGSADENNQANWLSNSQIRNYVKNLKAQHVLVIADSCFSGDLLDVNRSAAPVIDNAYYQKAISLTSRQVLTSGASETVPDQSEFGRQFVSCLERNLDPYIDAYSIYERIRRGVTKTLPLFGTLPGNEMGASFVLFRKQNPDKAILSVLTEEDPVTWLVSKENSKKLQDTNKQWQLEPGEYILYAQNYGDIEPTFMQEIVLKKGTLNTVRVPSLEWSKPYRIKDLQETKSFIEGQYARDKELRTKRVLRGLGSFLVAGAGTALGIYSYMDGVATYEKYKAAEDFSTASSLRSRLDRNTALMYTGAAVGGLCFTISLPLFFKDTAKNSRAKIHEIDVQIEELSK